MEHLNDIRSNNMNTSDEKKWFELVKSNYKMALFHNSNKLTFSNKYMVVNMKMN